MVTILVSDPSLTVLITYPAYMFTRTIFLSSNERPDSSLVAIITSPIGLSVRRAQKKTSNVKAKLFAALLPA